MKIEIRLRGGTIEIPYYAYKELGLDNTLNVEDRVIGLTVDGENLYHGGSIENLMVEPLAPILKFLEDRSEILTSVLGEAEFQKLSSKLNFREHLNLCDMIKRCDEVVEHTEEYEIGDEVDYFFYELKENGYTLDGIDKATKENFGTTYQVEMSLNRKKIHLTKDGNHVKTFLFKHGDKENLKELLDVNFIR